MRAAGVGPSPILGKGLMDTGSDIKILAHRWSGTPIHLGLLKRLCVALLGVAVAK
jgi:hypothetical protein